jgi:hypothetical protein
MDSRLFSQRTEQTPAVADSPMTLEQFKLLLHSYKVIRAQADEIGRKLASGEVQLGAVFQQLAMYEQVLGMAVENINFHAPIMKRKFGFETPESDMPSSATKLYSIPAAAIAGDKPEQDQNENDVQSPGLRK